MTQLTPPPETKNPIFEFTPGDLKPIDTKQESEDFQQVKQPIVLGWLKNAFRPILFTALGLHGLLLFVPLSSQTQVKPKETAEPVKLKRLSDKVLVKSMPKVKVTTATKPTLPKVTVASTNPIVIKSTEIPAELPKEEKKTPDEKKPDEKKPEKNTSDKPSDKGADPSKVDPKKATTDAKDASKLDAESQKFADVIAGLRKALNPGEAEADADANLLDDPAPFFNVKPSPQGNTLISNQDASDVATSLKEQFTEKFTKKADYGGGELYEVKVGNTVRYISLIQANSGKSVMVFLWEKSPI
ncbi:MAG: hypothetical protein LH631_01640 [Alkalinema sp. CAN_BIN05]|nr:hypothetical protein [Alkalinema sp. CAN_BIN05]